MTTPEQATGTASAYVAEHRHGCWVSGLQEDADDYLAVLSKDGPWPAGHEFVFVSKATGKLWTGTPGEVIEKVGGMIEVRSSQE